MFNKIIDVLYRMAELWTLAVITGSVVGLIYVCYNLDDIRLKLKQNKQQCHCEEHYEE